MNRFFWCLLILPFFGYSQGYKDTLQTKILSAASMQTDLQAYKDLLESIHPGLYRYTDKKTMDARFSTLEQELQRDAPFYDFYKKIAGFNAAIRCAHSFAMPVQNFDAYLNLGIQSFPLYVYPLEDKLYVVFNGTTDQTIKPGFELTHINQRPIDSIKAVLRKYYWADGMVSAARNKVLDGGIFGLFYYTLIERPDVFHLQLKDLQGKTVEISVPAQSLQETSRNFSKNPVNKQMLSYYNKNFKKPWRLKFPEDLAETAILRFDSFAGKGMNDETSATKTIRNFMDKSLAKIKKKKTRFLIIDVRDNGGGWDVQGAELLSYLVKADTTFPYYQRLHAITDDSPYFKYSDFSPQDLAAVKEELKQEADGTFSLLPNGSPNLLPQQAKKNRFQGEVFILMNGNSNSTTAEFTAMAQQLKVGTFIGEEAGGAAVGGNGGSFIRFTLPKSGIHVQVPLLYYQNAVGPNMQNGQGTHPDHLVQMSLADFLSNQDTTMNFAFELIRNTQN